jgi:hypothetical protein
MTAERFTVRWIGLLVLLAGLIVASPFVVSLLDANASCFGTETACRDMAQVFAHYGRAMILVLVVIPLLVAVAARTLTVGVFAWAFPFALLMSAGSLPLLHAIGGPDADSIDTAMAHPALIPLLFLLVLLVALSAESEGDERRFWRIMMGVFAVATIFVVSATWIPGLALMPFVGQAAEPIGGYLNAGHNALGLTSHLGQLTNTCLIAFALAAAGMMISARHARG